MRAVGSAEVLRARIDSQLSIESQVIPRGEERVSGETSDYSDNLDTSIDVNDITRFCEHTSMKLSDRMLDVVKEKKLREALLVQKNEMEDRVKEGDYVCEIC